jgi:hypothetical protein
MWFPALAEYNPISLYSAPDEMKVSFTAAQRVTLLKCLQYQEDKDSPGYVLCKGDWVANRAAILEYFNPDQPTMIHRMKPLGYELKELLDWDEFLNGKKTTIHKSAYSFSINVSLPYLFITTVESHLRPSYSGCPSRLLQGLRHQRSVFTLANLK